MAKVPTWKSRAKRSTNESGKDGIAEREPKKGRKGANKAKDGETVVDAIAESTGEPSSSGGGKGSGKQNRRRRRTNAGLKPAPLKSKDDAMIHVLNVQSRLLVSLSGQVRMLSGLLLTTIIMLKADEPAASALAEQEHFKSALIELRNKDENSMSDSAPLPAPQGHLDRCCKKSSER